LPGEIREQKEKDETLLRELTAAKQEIERLVTLAQNAAITLRQEFAGADDKEMEMAFSVADSLSASAVRPQPSDGGRDG
jgi:hypothetical protein